MTKVMWVGTDETSVKHALDLILDELQESLKFSDEYSDSRDRPEEIERSWHQFRNLIKKNIGDESLELTPDELASWVQNNRDRSIRILGHIMRRISEIKSLRESIERGDPSDEEVERVYSAIRNSIVIQVDKLDWQIEAMNFSLVRKTLKNLRLYSSALSDFADDDVAELKYPFDEFSEEDDKPY